MATKAAARMLPSSSKPTPVVTASQTIGASSANATRLAATAAARSHGIRRLSMVVRVGFMVCSLKKVKCLLAGNLFSGAAVPHRAGALK
jgi:hypothetical protein